MDGTAATSALSLEGGPPRELRVWSRGQRNIVRLRLRSTVSDVSRRTKAANPLCDTTDDRRSSFHPSPLVVTAPSSWRGRRRWPAGLILAVCAAVTTTVVQSRWPWRRTIGHRGGGPGMSAPARCGPVPPAAPAAEEVWRGARRVRLLAARRRPGPLGVGEVALEAAGLAPAVLGRVEGVVAVGGDIAVLGPPGHDPSHGLALSGGLVWRPLEPFGHSPDDVLWPPLSLATSPGPLPTVPRGAGG